MEREAAARSMGRLSPRMSYVSHGRVWGRCCFRPQKLRHAALAAAPTGPDALPLPPALQGQASCTIALLFDVMCGHGPARSVSRVAFGCRSSLVGVKPIRDITRSLRDRPAFRTAAPPPPTRCVRGWGAVKIQPFGQWPLTPC